MVVEVVVVVSVVSGEGFHSGKKGKSFCMKLGLKCGVDIFCNRPYPRSPQHSVGDDSFIGLSMVLIRPCILQPFRADPAGRTATGQYLDLVPHYNMQSMCHLRTLTPWCSGYAGIATVCPEF